MCHFGLVAISRTSCRESTGREGVCACVCVFGGGGWGGVIYMSVCDRKKEKERKE